MDLSSASLSCKTSQRFFFPVQIRKSSKSSKITSSFVPFMSWKLIVFYDVLSVIITDMYLSCCLRLFFWQIFQHLAFVLSPSFSARKTALQSSSPITHWSSLFLFRHTGIWKWLNDLCVADSADYVSHRCHHCWFFCHLVLICMLSLIACLRIGPPVCVQKH